MKRTRTFAAVFLFVSAAIACSLTVWATPSGPEAPTPTPQISCQFRVLIAYADSGRQPTEIRNEILFDRDVAGVDLFDASKATPTLGQLQQYGIVMVFANGFFSNATMLGDNLAAYVDGGGVVVQSAFSFSAPSVGGINGRWAAGNYCPYNYSTGAELSESSPSISDPSHP